MVTSIKWYVRLTLTEPDLPMASDEETAPTRPRVERIPGSDPHDRSNDTFILHQHDHTLGNPLRHMILKDPRTEFCG